MLKCFSMKSHGADLLSKRRWTCHSGITWQSGRSTERQRQRRRQRERDNAIGLLEWVCVSCESWWDWLETVMKLAAQTMLQTHPNSRRIVVSSWSRPTHALRQRTLDRLRCTNRGREQHRTLMPANKVPTTTTYKYIINKTPAALTVCSVSIPLYPLLCFYITLFPLLYNQHYSATRFSTIQCSVALVNKLAPCLWPPSGAF